MKNENPTINGSATTIAVTNAGAVPGHTPGASRGPEPPYSPCFGECGEAIVEHPEAPPAVREGPPGPPSASLLFFLDFGPRLDARFFGVRTGRCLAFLSITKFLFPYFRHMSPPCSFTTARAQVNYINHIGLNLHKLGLGKHLNPKVV